MQLALFKDIFFDVLMFPVWWYSRGLVLMWRWCQATALGYAKYMAIGVWMRNILVPMFGQRDWQSRLISIFMRLVQIFGRTFGLLVIWSGILVLGLAYIVGPMLVVSQVVYHVLGILTYGS
ncbi:MAG: hypothetical protein WAZ14_02675 [Patescibacteria group bacterium]